jgi:membrane protein implicated in regulation of membrane protease activity
VDGSNSTGRKIFGVVAIVAGLGIIVAALMGVELSWVVLALIPIVVLGYWSYHRRVVRPASETPDPPTGTDSG